MASDWTDHGARGNKRDAQKFARWMQRGGFTTRLRKEADGWHVETIVGSLSEQEAREHAHDRAGQLRSENPPPSPFRATWGESKSPGTSRSDLPLSKGETEREYARDMLGMSGGKPEPSSASGFGRWLHRHEQKRDAQKNVLLTTPVEPKQPEKESPRSTIAEGAADFELDDAIRDEKNIEQRKKLEADKRKHLLFRTHRYLPSMTRTTPSKVSGRGEAQIHPGAYKRNPQKGQGIVDMELQHERDRRN